MDMLSEVIAIFNRWNKKLLRQPILIFFNLIQPLVWFLLFTQAFSAIGNIPTFQFNPLIPPPGVEPSQYLELVCQITANAYFAGEGVISLLRKAINSADKLRVKSVFAIKKKFLSHNHKKNTFFKYDCFRQ